MGAYINAFGLGVIGISGNLQFHLQALAGIKEIGWIGCTGAEDVKPAVYRAGLLFYDDPFSLMQEKPVQGIIVVCSTLAERAYWCLKALELGKHVLCDQPLGEDYNQACRIYAASSIADRHMGMISRVSFTPSGLAMRHLHEYVDRLMFFDWRIACHRNRNLSCHEGISLRIGLEYLGLVNACLGPIDSVWARTRSLLHHSPYEDIASIALRFTDGKEGLLQFNGLGENDVVELNLYGRSGHRRFTHPPPLDDGDELRLVYANFVGAMAGDQKLVWGGRSFVDDYHLLHWIEQSARMNREIFRKEVVG
jgi:predicted dehydrogenase